MGIFENSLEASLLSIGRNSNWLVPSFPSGDPSRLPELASHGAPLNNAPKCIVWFAPRELMHAHGARVWVTTVLDTDTYTVTLGGTNPLNHDYLATGGDLAADIIDGLTLAINDGVDLTTLGGATLAYTNANPDTLIRSTGSWDADGVQVGDRVTATHTAANANDGITYTVAAINSSDELTLVTTDEATVVAGSTVTNFVVQRPVTATRETRSGVETLVITYALVHPEVDDPANTFTVAVSTLSTGALAFDEDALTGEVALFLVAKGVGVNKPEASQWCFARNGVFASINYLGLTERLDCASFDRIYPRLTGVTSPTTGATITYTLRVAPAILE